MAPLAAFPWYKRKLPLRIITQAYWSGKDPRLVSLQDTRFHWLLDNLMGVQLESSEEIKHRFWNELNTPDSALGHKLDAIVWEYLVETQKLPDMILRLQWAGRFKEANVLMADGRNLAREYAPRIIDVIKVWDQNALPEVERRKAIQEEIRKGEIRKLLEDSQMLHDDVTVCRPAKSIATR